ncbi:hypothetical protein [Kitasatospora griseola]|uniref:hypothetical protein n=1 Tax=Kitasatospora griseola TaxID=2064 RepID=UPI001670DB9B|nr:hypothetical protein [Kitasatospora griseola]
MAWWGRKQGDRQRWVLDPLVGVGPLRFGMDPQQVQDALGEKGNFTRFQGGWGDTEARRMVSERYDEPGLTAFYGPGPRLAAVVISAVGGPLVRLGEVELVARAPSAASADLCRLALEGRVEARVNRHGEAEVPAWGVSLDVAQEWGLAPEGHLQRRDAVITGLLATGPAWAEDLWNTEPVADRLGLRGKPADAGPWLVADAEDRPRWQCTPLEGVGPLRFGMSPQQVSAALDGEAPAESRGHHPFAVGSPWEDEGTPEEWHVDREYYARAGVTAHYSYASQARRGSVLVRVSVHGRSGPLVSLYGIELIGRKPSAVEADVIRCIQDRGLDLRMGCSGDFGPGDSQVWARAERAGDTSVSAACFCIEGFEYHG